MKMKSEMPKSLAVIEKASESLAAASSTIRLKPASELLAIKPNNSCCTSAGTEARSALKSLRVVMGQHLPIPFAPPAMAASATRPQCVNPIAVGTDGPRPYSALRAAHDTATATRHGSTPMHRSALRSMELTKVVTPWCTFCIASQAVVGFGGIPLC